jgi:hypothetical protein
MWFRGQNVPILYGGRRKDIFASEDWVATGTVQKIGATLFALIFFLASLSLFGGSFLLRNEPFYDVGTVLSAIFRTLLVALCLGLGCAAMFIAIRLSRGIFRSFHK